MEIIKYLQDGEVLLTLSKELYSHDAILKSSYKFTDNFYIQVDSDEKYFKVKFSLKKDNEDIKDQIAQFCNELIDQQIRYSLHKSDKSIKELIIKKAFFPFKNDENE